VIEAIVGVDLAARMTRVGVKRAILCASAKRARALRNARALCELQWREAKNRDERGEW
jgi:hypothetical protein